MKNIALLIILSTLSVFAQKEANNWHFGNYCGITFNMDVSCRNPPCVIQSSIIDDGVLQQGEGTASISDSSGRLLFYTSGARVWDKNNNIM
ncbi:MAG: hypothetical protein QG635_2247, partial [Bacteroidota bacterium]|nr:hypothetical protein [Bacteroidota bacterium]